jgi:hypothetical protein
MLIFRDPLSHGGTRLPTWLEGCPELQRMQTDNGDLLTAGDPLFLVDPVGVKWKDLDDGYQVTTTNGIDHDRYLRRRMDIERIRVKNAKGVDWFAPRILAEGGGDVLSLPWGKKDGVRVRSPTDEQARLLIAAGSARTEILSGKLGEVPIDIIAEWTHILLESVYHFSSDVIDALELLDDTLIGGVLLASSGFPKPLPETAVYAAL